ncbi:hypothetical protein SNEBB_000661 [Seison nebaliae]|nr:hypothetical protein SNEBB_000661 [Seison nebaliae]
MSIRCVTSLLTSTANRRYLHLSTKSNSMEEFFGDEEEWKGQKLKFGRSWKKEELRLKSNRDLHQLWFVLLKSRNMVMTLEEEFYHKYETFPSPERIDILEESMENLLYVVNERDRALAQLDNKESRHDKLNEKTIRINSLGIRQPYRKHEYHIPWYVNSTWKLKWLQPLPKFIKSYQSRFVEKERNRQRSIERRFKEFKARMKNKFPETAKETEIYDEQSNEFKNVKAIDLLQNRRKLPQSEINE